MKNKYTLKILIISTALILFCGIKNIYAAEETMRMEINNGNAWVNINISQSYKACENLNKTTSTLGTILLQAHLTTDEDWSAMSVLSVSQYGAATTNSPETTTGNLSGVYNVGKRLTQTTGVSSAASKDTNIYLSGLFDETGSLKKYVKTWDLSNREGNGHVGFRSDGTYGWYGSDKYFDKNNGYPVSIKSGLFGVVFGSGSGYYAYASGGPFDKVTFRPVIWN